MRLPILFVVGLLLVAGAWHPVRADGLDEIVVSASRSPETVFDAAASVSHIDLDRAEARGALFIGEELIGLPGVRVDRAESGTQTSVTIRGVPNRIGNDSFVAYLDGVPFVTPDDESDLEDIPALARERTEVLRGPSSALFGRGTTAGTVHFRSPEVQRDLSASARVAIGSDGFRRFGGELTTPTVGGGALLARLSGETGTGWRARTERDEYSAYLKHEWQASDIVRLTTSAYYSDSDQDIAGALPTDALGERIALPGGRFANFDQPDARFDRTLVGGTAQLDLALTARLSTRTIVHGRNTRSTAVEGFLQPFQRRDRAVTVTGFRVDGDDRFTFASQQLRYEESTFDAVIGIDHEWIDGDRFETFTGLLTENLFFAQQRDLETGALIRPDRFVSARLLDVGSEHRNLAAYGQSRVRLGDWEAEFGLRWDRFIRRADYRPLVGPFGPDPGALIEDRDGRTSFRGALSYRLNPDINLYAGYGQGFSPGFGPLFSFRQRARDLNPERAWQIEVGAKARLWDERLGLSIAGYQLKRRDLIQVLPQGPTAVTVNAGAHRVRGVELTAQLALDPLLEGFGLGANYAYTASLWLDNRFIDPASGLFFDFSGNRVAGVSPHSGSLSIRYAAPDRGFRFTGFWELVGNYPIDGQNSDDAGGYAIVNASAAWTPHFLPQVTLTVRGRNLFDSAAGRFISNAERVFAVAPLPPRQFFVELRAGL